MKTINDLRVNLIQSIDDIKSGKLKPEIAKLMCQQTQTIINITKLEINYNHSQKSYTPIKFMHYDSDNVDIKTDTLAQNIDNSKHKTLMKNERYKNNCNDCLHLQSIESVIPPKINCMFGGKLECVLLDFDKCKKLNP